MLAFSHFITIIAILLALTVQRCYMFDAHLFMDMHFSSLCPIFRTRNSWKLKAENVQYGFLFANPRSFLFLFYFIFYKSVSVCQTPFRFIISFQMSIHCVVVVFALYIGCFTPFTCIYMCGQWLRRFSSSFFFHFIFFFLKLHIFFCSGKTQKGGIIQNARKKEKAPQYQCYQCKIKFRFLRSSRCKRGFYTSLFVCLPFLRPFSPFIIEKIEGAWVSINTKRAHTYVYARQHSFHLLKNLNLSCCLYSQHTARIFN